MIPSTLFALVAVLSSFAAVNGAVIQRDGTFTYLTPQPTAPGQAATTTTTATSTSSRPSSTTSTQSTTPTTSGTTATSTTPATTSTNTGTTTSVTVTIPTTTLPTTTSTTSVSVSRSTTPTNTGISTSATVITPTTTSPTTTPTTSVSVSRSTTPTNTGTITSATVIPPTTSLPTTTSAITTPAPGAANCNGIQQWQASFAYTAGDQVIFNGQLFTAKQWTYDNAPNAHPDQWTASGTCVQPINNLANCNGVAAWNRNVAYITGNRVTFSGHLWSAVQWSQSNAPGDTSGSWKDLGACA